MKTKAFGVLALLAACGASNRTEDRRAPMLAAERPAMALPLAALTVRGDLLVKREAAWEPLAAGGSLGGVREIKAVRRGAIVALGDGPTAPVVYLRAGTHLAVGQEGAVVHLAVREGRARVRHGATAQVVVDTSEGEAPVTGDVLVDAAPKSRADVVPTGARPAAAEWSFALALPETGAGFGRMEARAAADRMDLLALASLHVDVKTAGDLAVTEVTHVFHNAADEQREGTFRFPLPDGAMLVGLALEIEGRMVEGEIVEREKARAVYEKIVDEMLDPALLEWEQGNWFKLRVFPLPANGDKKVVIRYVTPLQRGASGWEYAYTMSTPDHGALGEFAVSVDGKLALAQRDVAQGVDLVVPVPAARVPAVMKETRQDAVYTAVRFAPNLTTMTMPPATGRKIAVVFDTSRSALEGRAQALEVLEATLKQLSPTDAFVVLASDVEVRPTSETFVPVTPEAIVHAIDELKAVEPDGASDAGAALAAVDQRDPTDVIYIGDGIATWGELRPAELGKLADKIGAPIEAALIGKGATTSLWGELSGRTGGRAMIVKSQLDQQRFALAATQAEVPRLVGARVTAPAGSLVFPQQTVTLFTGDEIVAVMKTPADQPMPAALALTGTIAGKPYTETVSLTAAAPTDRVAQRWARQELARMEAGDATKEDIVALSTELGVLSKHTSLLVLENDEAYAQHQIARKQQQAQQLAQAQAPTVTGGDLDTLGSRRASLSPDEIQPGDPEIKIPAPRDARSVVVSFPFGETKLAMWDDDQAAWMVRFLIDQQTADGVYQVRVAITHADGRVEVLSLPYTVDTKAPLVTVTAVKQGAGYLIKARQQADDYKRKDADRVEVQLPDGTILELKQTAWGRFEGRWQPASPLGGPVTLRVVARDNALNQATSELVLP